jgi:endonuclease III
VLIISQIKIISKPGSDVSPCDQWEDWIDNFQHEHGCDRAFMCLLIIIMSSSTADTQLANIVPRLFSSGLTSAKAVIEVAQQYGLNTFCSLFSEGGRYYQNAERILNAADYFVQYHGGTIPESITVNELCTLFGVGYKTANIVVTTAFGRVDGIPSDIHVIRWSSMLGWCTSNVDGLKCSKLLEAWLPHSKWESINPVFGAFGQLLVSDKRDDLLQIAKQHPSSDIRALFRTASKVYQREKKID